MEVLGVGPLEILFILIIALIVLGPNDMAKAGRTIGRTLRKIVMSPTWHAVQQTSRELRNLPTRLMRDAGLEEEVRDLRRDVEEIRKLRSPFSSTANQLTRESQDLHNEVRSNLGAWTTPPAETTEPEIAPPGTPNPPQPSEES